MSNVTLQLCGSSLGECLRYVGLEYFTSEELAAELKCRGGTIPFLQIFGNDELLHELTRRGMGGVEVEFKAPPSSPPPHGPRHTIEVNPTPPTFDGTKIYAGTGVGGRDPAETTAPTTTKRKPGRPSKAEIEAREKAKAAAEDVARAEATVPTPADDWADTPAPTPAPSPAGAGSRRAYTESDVREALQKASQICGLVTVRAEMAKVGGSSKLIDIPEAKFGELIAALNRMASASEANRAAHQQAT